MAVDYWHWFLIVAFAAVWVMVGHVVSERRLAASRAAEEVDPLTEPPSV